MLSHWKVFDVENYCEFNISYEITDTDISIQHY